MNNILILKFNRTKGTKFTYFLQEKNLSRKLVHLQLPLIVENAAVAILHILNCRWIRSLEQLYQPLCARGLKYPLPPL